MRSDTLCGKQVVIEDPSGNPIESFEPTEGEPGPTASGPREQTYQVRPIGWVRSTLIDPSDAPNQGDQGAPDGWLDINADVLEGIRDIEVGTELLVLTWLHQARRDELATQPGDDPTGPERGVFSTRSPARPNPVGLHRVTVVEIEDGKLRVRPLEAIDGTPIVDLKPVIRSNER
jgi:tRNA-Thr(GGU) m(6)t(6)A37 methyltransferase TsaA